MTDLTTKFDTLESQLTTQHAELMAALETIGEQLAAVALALVPEPPTVTLADVIAAIQAGNDIAIDSQARLAGIETTIGDVHTDTMSMDGKLLTIRDTVGDIHLDTMSMDQKLLTMRDDLLDLLNEAKNITSATRATHDRLAEIKDLIDDIPGGTGRPTADDMDNIINTLLDISNRSAALVSGQQQLIDCGCPGEPEGCENPYSSGDMWLAPYGIFGFDSVMVATWPTPPEGVSYGTVFGLVQDNTELYNADWSGWMVYVESSEPQYADSLGTARYPTGVWRSMPPGEGNYTWSVNQKGSLRVTLCPPDAAPPTIPDDPFGWYGSGQTLDHDGADKFKAQADIGIGGYAPTTLRPNPNMTLGATLYFHNCYNSTTNSDKSLYLAMDEHDEGSIFLTVPEGATVPWVVNTSESALWIWTWSLPEDQPGHGFQLILAWTAEEAEAHCVEPT